jgi:hypothetical protein
LMGSEEITCRWRPCYDYQSNAMPKGTHFDRSRIDTWLAMYAWGRVLQQASPWLSGIVWEGKMQ